LLATQVISRLQVATGLEIPLADLFREPTVAGLAGLIESGRRAEPAQPLPPIQPLPRDRAFPLAYAQERMWFLHQLAPDNAAYHIPTAVSVTGPQDEARWRAAIDLMIQRHEGLRTIFRLENEHPVQEILPDFVAPYQLIDLTPVPDAEQDDQLQQIIDYYVQQPFDIATTPAWRMATIKLAAEHHVLLVVVHHIIFDQWSAGLFWNDLVLLYEGLLTADGANLPAVPVQYPDFAVWQREWLQGEALAQMLGYWREQLRDVATLTFPTDRPRPPMQTFNGDMVLREIPADLVGRIRATGRAENVTHFMVMLAAFNLLLQKYTDQQDVVVGVPVANRHRLAVENIIGTFVNSLVMRSDLSGDPTFNELLARTRTVTLDAYAHQELPFEKLVEELQTTRDFSRTPFFQIMFNMVNAPFEPISAAGTDFSVREFSRQVSQFDFSVTTSISTHRSLKSLVTIEYNTDLFAGDTMERLADHYLELLSQVTADAAKPISAYTILTNQEQQQLARWNETALAYPDASCLHTLFSGQAAQTPDRIAVTDGRQQLTYAELETRTNQLARFLQGKGVRPDMFVGLYTERHVDMVVGLLGILKAGAAYLPLDPAFPADRLAYMLEDSAATLMLTESKLVEFAPEFAGEMICLDRDWSQIATASHAPVTSAATATNLAYIIYTSGSTGKPKGVLLQHQGVVNFLTSMRQQPGLTVDDTLLAVTTLSFDISVLEVFLPLTTGAKLVVVSKEISADGWLLAEALAEHQATVMQATPVTWSMLIDTGWQGTASLRK
ncbi:MAG: AMP-binding protein, partial [Anaerolineales bacterium]|nr:AMP-binding protein [Anaerolineales bacterium]